MNRILTFAAVVGGVYLVLARKRSGYQPSPAAVPPTYLLDVKRLDSDLQSALLYGNGPRWDEVSEGCRKIGRPDLPGHVSGKLPELEQRLNWPET
jgi:hypothetical protein